ncbi:unnamed protein product [Vitrella brassicaformis CCMP3155]|uniref:Uncharacterized protein n=1 Tax=Vitrella brassicaformis (strain CCMP3155) TaxID=1169540 RepID=A0A0G4G5H1_VITBC|nr:unnamed protein product [Vitrella brassicaformis CCMP3155]|eukprot:CEM23485.1 unnamed protein product [Vitrella brassicaformis CCMP3155]
MKPCVCVRLERGLRHLSTASALQQGPSAVLFQIPEFVSGLRAYADGRFGAAAVEWSRGAEICSKFMSQTPEAPLIYQWLGTAHCRALNMHLAAQSFHTAHRLAAALDAHSDAARLSGLMAALVQVEEGRLDEAHKGLAGIGCSDDEMAASFGEETYCRGHLCREIRLVQQAVGLAVDGDGASSAEQLPAAAADSVPSDGWRRRLLQLAMEYNTARATPRVLSASDDELLQQAAACETSLEVLEKKLDDMAAMDKPEEPLDRIIAEENEMELHSSVCQLYGGWGSLLVEVYFTRHRDAVTSILEEPPDQLTKSGIGLLKKGLKRAEGKADLEQGGLCMAALLSGLAAVYSHFQQVVVAEGLFTSALDKFDVYLQHHRQTDMTPGIRARTVHSQALLNYSKLLRKWEDREGESDRVAAKATTVLQLQQQQQQQQQPTSDKPDNSSNEEATPSRPDKQDTADQSLPRPWRVLSGLWLPQPSLARIADIYLQQHHAER